MNVLFVCSGNICRSPMAEALLRAAAPELSVDSAGTLGIVGSPASREAIAALSEIGVELRAHRSKGASVELLEQSDLVIVMEQGHLEELAALSSRRVDRRRLLRAFEAGPVPSSCAPDLPDPIGHPLGFYRESLRILRPCIDHIAAFCARREGDR